MQNVQLSVFNPEQLEQLLTTIVNNAIEKRLQALTPPKQEEEYLTRLQTAKKLGIALSTLHEYTMAGFIPAYRIGSRVRYKKEEVEQSLAKMKTVKPSTLC